MATITELMEQHDALMGAAQMLRKRAAAEKAAVQHAAAAQAAEDSIPKLNLEQVRETLNVLADCHLVKKAEVEAAVNACAKDPNELLNIITNLGEQAAASQDLAESPGTLVKTAASAKAKGSSQARVREAFTSLSRRLSA